MRDILKSLFGGKVYGDASRYKFAIVFLALGYAPFVLFFLYVLYTVR